MAEKIRHFYQDYQDRAAAGNTVTPVYTKAVLGEGDPKFSMEMLRGIRIASPIDDATPPTPRGA